MIAGTVVWKWNEIGKNLKISKKKARIERPCNLLGYFRYPHYS